MNSENSPDEVHSSGWFSRSFPATAGRTNCPWLCAKFRDQWLTDSTLHMGAPAPDFEMRWLWRKLSPRGKACLVQVSNYNVEQSVSELGFHHKTRCRLTVMLGLNLHMRMLGALSLALQHYFLLDEKVWTMFWMTNSSFSERGSCYFQMHSCAMCLERNKGSGVGVVWHIQTLDLSVTLKRIYIWSKKFFTVTNVQSLPPKGYR